eukprot:CAMPEP_0194772604 /NCGR_PEP_ID=MMETSP0323_2-20130528/52482_1 /TAXON_ID=2866 ORGANISM="Crypthecodinium cohnii, Strain Seligo" /NCGR_SAMPLE_ID=MMETSP0323_2 /ASSEMBLY_ACC=CAM_ASM_000346 /LENGTH=128 /DNA_ID=CAMNT_0039707203 /DNA_START=190 /DNA_END=576 /DNA_ORIENTATION=-
MTAGSRSKVPLCRAQVEDLEAPPRQKERLPIGVGSNPGLGNCTELRAASAVPQADHSPMRADAHISKVFKCGLVRPCCSLDGGRGADGQGEFPCAEVQLLHQELFEHPSNPEGLLLQSPGLVEWQPPR